MFADLARCGGEVSEDACAPDAMSTLARGLDAVTARAPLKKTGSSAGAQGCQDSVSIHEEEGLEEYTPVLPPGEGGGL